MDGNVQGNAPDGRNAFRKGFDYLRSRGLKEFGARAVEKVRDARFDYDAWVRRQEPSPSLVGYQKNLWMKRSPVLSVILTSPEAGSMEEAAHRDLQEADSAGSPRLQDDRMLRLRCLRQGRGRIPFR